MQDTTSELRVCISFIVLLVLTVFIQRSARSNRAINSRYSSSPDTSTAKKQRKAETTPEEEADSVKALPKKSIKKEQIVI